MGVDMSSRRDAVFFWEHSMHVYCNPSHYFDGWTPLTERFGEAPQASAEDAS